VLTRILTPEQFGWYALAFASINLAHMASLTWIEAAALRFHAAAREAGEAADHFALLLRLWALGSLAFAAVGGAFVALAPLEEGLRIALAAGLGGVAIRAGLKIALETRRAAGEVQRYVLIDILHTGGGFVLGVAAILALNLGAAGPFVGLLVAGALCLALEGPALARQARGGAASAAKARAYAAYGLPIALALCLDLALSSGDRFMINAYLGAEAVGAYAAGYQLANRPIEIIVTWAAVAAAPLLVAAYERGDGAGVEAVGRQAFTAILALGTPAATGIALTAEPLSAVLIGEALRTEAAQIAPWIALSALMSGLMIHYFSEAFQLARKTLLRAGLVAAPALLNLGLNALLLPLYGLQGAVMATLAAYAVGVGLLAVVGRGLVALPTPIDTLIKIAAATGIMAAVVAALPTLDPPVLALTMKASVGALVYGLAVLALDLGGMRAMLLARLRPAEAA
jgi:O-antigen/teichoic acid export membrane protein